MKENSDDFVIRNVKFKKWAYPLAKRTKRNVQEETALRQFLDLVQIDSNKDETVSKLVEKALRKGFYDLAVEALGTLSSDSGYYACTSIREIFQPEYWAYITPSVTEFCTAILLDQTLNAPDYDSQSEISKCYSKALGIVGVFQLFNDSEEAFMLWDTAQSRLDVEKAILEVSLFILENSPEDQDIALTLAQLISSNELKTKATQQISEVLLSDNGEDEISISDIAAKIMGSADSSGDIRISIKATVKNNTLKTKRVHFYVQAVDKDGFELKSASLSGTLKPRETRILTDQTYIKEKHFKAIEKWQFYD